MFARIHTTASGLYPNQLYLGHISEGIEHANGIAATANTGDYHIRHTPCLRLDLHASLAPNNRLKVTHDAWIGVWSHRRADQVESCFHVGDPITNALVNGVLERAAAAGNRTYLCSQQFHAENIERLALNVNFDHAYNTFK